MSAKPEPTEAERIAESYAPKPTGGALMAGASAGIVGFGAAWGVMAFYRLSLAVFWPGGIALAAITAVSAFVIYKRAGRRNRRAVRSEQAILDQSRASPPPAGM